MSGRIVDLLIEPSYSCNLRCRHCSSVGVEERPISFYWTLRRIVSSYKVEQIRISGGEPTVYPNLRQLIYWLRSEFGYGGKIILQTNGVEYFYDCEIDQYWISLYGDKPFHEWVTQVRGSFDRTIDTLREHYEDSPDKVIVQTPVFDFVQFKSMDSLIKKYPFLSNITFRFTRLLQHGSAEFLLSVYSREHQFEVARTFPYKKIITCSLTGKNCSRDKKLIIRPDGRVFRCASCKHGINKCSDKIESVEPLEKF